MQNYTITIDPPNKNKSSMYSAHCAEWNFITEDETPERALVGLLDALRIAEEEKKKKKNPLFTKEITFQIPAFA